MKSKNDNEYFGGMPKKGGIIIISNLIHNRAFLCLFMPRHQSADTRTLEIHNEPDSSTKTLEN